MVSLNKAFLFALKAWFQYTEQQNLIFIVNILQNSQAHNNITAIITISQFIIYKYNIRVYYITFPIISHSKMESLLFPLTFGLEIHVIRVDLKTEKAFIWYIWMTWIIAGRVVNDIAGFILSFPLLNSLFFHFFIVSDQFWLYFLKFAINQTDTVPQLKQDKSETYNYAKSNLPTAFAYGSSKVKVHKFTRSLLKSSVWVFSFQNNGSMICHMT